MLLIYFEKVSRWYISIGLKLWNIISYRWTVHLRYNGVRNGIIVTNLFLIFLTLILFFQIIYDSLYYFLGTTFLFLFGHNSVICYFRFLETKAFHRKPAKQIHHVIMRHNLPSSSNILSSFFACNNEQNKWKIFLKVKVKEIIDYNFALKLQILAQDCFVFKATALFNWLYQALEVLIRHHAVFIIRYTQCNVGYMWVLVYQWLFNSTKTLTSPLRKRRLSLGVSPHLPWQEKVNILNLHHEQVWIYTSTGLNIKSFFPDWLYYVYWKVTICFFCV